MKQKQYSRHIAIFGLVLMGVMPCHAFGQDDVKKKSADVASVREVSASNVPHADADSSAQNEAGKNDNRQFSDCEKIKLLLNAHCDMPTLEDLNSTSTIAESCLLEIFQDQEELLSVRLRALESLALYGGDADIDLRDDLVRRLDHPDGVTPRELIQAIRSYSKIDPDNAPDKLAPFLAYDNDMVRFVTISSLCGNSSANALRVLKARYDVETNSFFQRRLYQAINGHGKKGLYCE